MANWKDKINVFKQLLATLTSTYDQPHHPSSFNEDQPSLSPPASVH